MVRETSSTACVSAQQANLHRVQIGMRQIPQLDGTEIVEMDAVRNRVGMRLTDGGIALRALGQYTIALAKTDFESQRLFRCFRCAE